MYLWHSLETLDVEYKWWPPQCLKCKLFGHEDYDCPSKDKLATSKPSSGNGCVREVGSKSKKKGVNKEGKRIILRDKTLPITMDGANGIGNKPNVSLIVWMDDSSPHTNDNGYFKDDIDLVQLKNNIKKLMDEGIKEATVQEKGNLWEHFKKAKEALTSKPKSTMSDLEDVLDEDEVYLLEDMSKYISSTGGGFTMEDDDLDYYDGYGT
ncbi:ATPase, F1/V1/A1 complex, alpha/beta subunit [Tanacetum coccineum]